MIITSFRAECDRCGRTEETEAASADAATDKANMNGWLGLSSFVHSTKINALLCPDCASAYGAFIAGDIVATKLDKK